MGLVPLDPTQRFPLHPGAGPGPLALVPTGALLSLGNLLGAKEIGRRAGVWLARHDVEQPPLAVVIRFEIFDPDTAGTP